MRKENCKCNVCGCKTFISRKKDLDECFYCGHDYYDHEENKLSDNS